MTNEEIKKALEFCDRDDYFFCGGCAYDNVRNCHDKLQADALNLITEQEKEIERLKAEFKQLETNAEILARGVRDLNHENYELTEQVKQAKGEPSTLGTSSSYLVRSTIPKIKVFRTDGQSLEKVLNTIGYENVLDIVSEHCSDGAIIDVIYEEPLQAEVKE